MMLTWHTMDLIGVREIRVAKARDDLAFAPGDRILGGGTWLFSETQDDVATLVDLTGLDWAPITSTEAGLSIAATCTIRELAALTQSPLFSQCANSLLASFKIWNVATVGGNIALALPAGPMTTLAVTLDATLVVWTATGQRRIPAADFVTGVLTTVLEPGEVLRSIEIPRAALFGRTGFRRIALSPLGRTGTLVTALLSEPGVTFTVTGGTTHPVQLRFDRMPTAPELAAAVGDIDCWYDDAHGSPDWRRAMSILFAEELREELS
jgi:xanthine dehydrogenase iron-sulfur cluster and FAD-binding subunit A